MKLRAAIVLPAVIAAGAIASLALMLLTPQRALPSALLQQPTPTPTNGLLDGRVISLQICCFFTPYGFITEEAESLLEGTVGFGSGKPTRVKYYSGKSPHYGKYIATAPEISLPKKVHLRTSHFKYGFVWPPGMSPEDPIVYNTFYYGGVHTVRYECEKAVIAFFTGHFLFGEEQESIFWFLFEQLGNERAVIVPSESYEKWWGEQRESCINTLTLTPPPPTPATPSTLPPLPPRTPALSTKQR